MFHGASHFDFAEVLGGTAAHASGNVRRTAGHGGNGQCSAVQLLVLDGSRWKILGTKGKDGNPGLASIRACRQVGTKKVDVRRQGWQLVIMVRCFYHFDPNWDFSTQVNVEPKPVVGLLSGWLDLLKISDMRPYATSHQADLDKDGF